MPKPGLLLFNAETERLIGDELCSRFEVVRLWEASDADAFLDARGPGVIATLTTRLSAAMLAKLPNLRLIAVVGAGFDQIAVAEARARGVTVANAGGAHSIDVADHAVALTLASVHRLIDMDTWVRSGGWKAGTAMPPRRHAMSAQRFGIVGLGHIGTAIAERLEPFGGEIAWWSRRPKKAPWPRRDSLMDLAQWCSVLLVAAQGDAVGLIDAAVIAAVGADGRIVNIARGAVIDEDALVAALKEGRLGGAALDVFANEPTPPERWRDVPNVVFAPHVGGNAHEALLRLRAAALINLRSVLDGTPVVAEITGA